MSIVRENLMTRPGYTPYCGSDRCSFRMPRTAFDGSQFKCQCGWRSGFEAEFIEQYVRRWWCSGSSPESKSP
jgi:hypothetical protein